MTHGLVRAYGPFELHHGCEPGDDFCWGPVGEYWMLYESELRMLSLHALVAVVVAIVLGVALWRFGRARGWRRAGAGSVAAALVAAPLFFLALVRAFPVHIVY